ncbi:MAG TPA: septum formation initiator family protein [Desulfatirhabdiaceae bacterium]|nr:septum formation initiator family protein [Desulfatirhabdiaceae bacterium]
MQHTKSYIKENFTILILVFLILLMLFLIIAGDKGLAGLKQVRQQKEMLTQSNKSLRLKNYEMYRKIERLKTDPVFIEAVARTDLGLIRKDELVFKPLDSTISEPSPIPSRDRSTSSDD